MGTNQSKGLFRVLPYNCHELAHTWDPNCSSTALDLGFGALFECYKIYTAVYAVTISFLFSLNLSMAPLD